MKCEVVQLLLSLPGLHISLCCFPGLQGLRLAAPFDKEAVIPYAVGVEIGR